MPSTVQKRKVFPSFHIRNRTFQSVFDDLLEAFNFTVREDTPLDQDVAVDPEMLGKVFESIVLLTEEMGEYNAPDKRKATGSYYTPRIVVHFICREALRLYLKGRFPGWDTRIDALFNIDLSFGITKDDIAALKGAGFTAQDGTRLLDVLRAIKMCDPAVGSGAFPVGLLQELVGLRRIAETIANGMKDLLRSQGTGWTRETKRDIVANNLYGVDLQQQAVEICRLRLWLSLIIDYDLGMDPFEASRQQFLEKIKEISQLPNLEMNFRRGDSLLDLISDVNVRVAQEKSHAYQTDVDAICALGRKLHAAKESAKKRALRLEILHRRLDFAEKIFKSEIRALSEDTPWATMFPELGDDSHKGQCDRASKEIARLEDALKKLAADRRELEDIEAHKFDLADFYTRLRKLEGTEFNGPYNFSWHIDFADIFKGNGGFDLVRGNPTFVTARNEKKRELYRERWKSVCKGDFGLVCPFFMLSFGLLKESGQLGFIVSTHSLWRGRNVPSPSGPMRKKT